MEEILTIVLFFNFFEDLGGNYPSLSNRPAFAINCQLLIPTSTVKASRTCFKGIAYHTDKIQTWATLFSRLL